MAISLKEALIRALVEKGLLTEEKLKEALRIQGQQGGDLKDVLAELGFVSKENIISILSQELGIPPINLLRFKIDPAILKLVPKNLAQTYHILPVSRIENILTVAMEDPLNIFALDHIRTLTGLKIVPVLSPKKDIERAISESYEEQFYEEMEAIVSNIADQSSLEVVDTGGEGALDATAIIRATKEAPVIRLADQLLNEAVKLRSSDVLIEPFETYTRIRYRVDGILRQIQNFPKHLHAAVVSRFKIMSDLDIAEQRLPQDGRFKLDISGKDVDFRISVLPSVLGEKVALRILDKSTAVLDIEKLGFNKKAMQDLKTAASRPHGMILVCGPTGSGKTTTLYSLLRLIPSSEENIVTVEDPIEYQMEGFNQVAVRTDLGLTFANALRSILRQDPDVIMIGEIRDYETADIAVKSALTGHLLFTTVHTTTATGAIVRLINMGVEPFLLSSSITLTAAQRLTRKICPDCSQPYDLPEQIETRLGIKERGRLTFYRGKGCKTCFNTGYSGRTALIETLTITPSIRKLISERADEYKIRDQARREGMITLREDGLAKARAGAISIEEVLRVTAGEQDIPTRN
ncbi:MAG: Flp pilus assembly complex ATPase component TadA [Candidatus Omnitrophica bacterium]|nr:Flp pilus assembly complex ATPase component TadA [Candidatus Omnitrophota bacterium]